LRRHLHPCRRLASMATTASTLRKRKSGGVEAAADSKVPANGKVSIDTSVDHLGVTLANEQGRVVIIEAHPADAIFKAGLRVGDAITSVNGNPVSTHEAAMDIINGCAGNTIFFEYLTAAQVAVAMKAERALSAARRARILRTLGKCIGYFAICALFACAIAYRYAPQDQFQDYVDVHVLPKIGFALPPMGLDMRPKRRVIPPKDPLKPWTVPGWNREKDRKAIALIKESMFFFGATREAEQLGIEPEKTPFMLDLMEQVRSSDGQILKLIVEMEEDARIARAQFG